MAERDPLVWYCWVGHERPAPVEGEQQWPCGCPYVEGEPEPQ